MKLYTSIIIIGFFALLSLISMIVKNNLIANNIKKWIIITLALIIVASFCECLGIYLDGSNSKIKLIYIMIKFIELSIGPLIPFIFSKTFTNGKFKFVILIIVILNCVVHFLSIFFKITFYVDNQNVYHHGKFYFLYYLNILISYAYLIYTILKDNSKFQNINTISLCMITLFVLFGTICQIIDSSIKVVWLTVEIGTILLYIYYYNILLETDGLTEVLNRRTFDCKIQKVKGLVGIIFFDINNFKSINDTYGHQFGDLCLKITAKVLKETYNKVGKCYRIGGDEFCVILNKNVDTIEEYNKKFIAKMKNEQSVDDRIPSVAIGYDIFNADDTSVSNILKNADDNMYFNKKEKSISKE